MKTPKLKIFTLLLAFLILPFSFVSSRAQTLKVAFLRADENLRPFYQKIRQELAKSNNLRFVDDDLSLAAARGLNFKNFFNLSLEEAQNFGTAADCDFFFVVRSETVRRSSFQKEVYFESRAIIFLASGRSGRLIAWENANFQNDAPEAAEEKLLEAAGKTASRFVAKMETAFAAEQAERASPAKTTRTLEILDSEFAARENIRAPLPYKRLRPVYTQMAESAGVEATVDVAVDLNASGEVQKAEIVRWAGFGLDEETIATVKKMQFRPALKDDKPTPARFVLRYNFRRPRE